MENSKVKSLDSNYRFNGVKPKCVESRLFHVNVSNNQPRTLQITELELRTQFGDSPPQPKCLHIINLPETFNMRIIGRPIVIGCKDHLLILQYLLQKSNYIHFFLVDTMMGSLQCFEDEEKYFNKCFASICPLECLISPDLTRALFRLPQNIMSSRKWSKLLCADLKFRETEDLKTYFISNTKNSVFRDRRNQTVALDPRYKDRCVFIVVNEYCSRCSMIIYDLNEKNPVAQKDFRLNQKECLIPEEFCVKYLTSHDDEVQEVRSDYEEEEDEDGDSLPVLPNYFTLEQCNSTFCRSGEILVLCCTTTDQNCHENLQVFMFHVDDLDYCGMCCTDLREMSAIFVLEHQLFTPVFSRCDMVVSLWCFERGDPPVGPLIHIRLPKKLNLQGLCRVAVLQAVQENQIEALPLPKRLQDYLQFYHDFNI